MTTDTDQRIIRAVPAERVKRVFLAWGATWHNPWDYPIETTELRAAAAAYRDDIASALIALADEVDTAPLIGTERLNITDDDVALFRDWAYRTVGQPPLLNGFRDELTNLGDRKNPSVFRAMQTLAMLKDADLFLPGVDAALRPALSVYAGIEPSREET